MQITVHRGTHEVGGTCIEVSTKQTRIILDVGLPLFMGNSNRQPHDSFQLRRMSKENLLKKGILPSVPGLFVDGSAPDAILLSHAHLDHTGLLNHADPTIPVYASSGTSKMMLAGSMFSMQVGLPREQHQEIKPEKPVKIGDFTVTAFPVDHSIFGCLAFLVEADGKSILYTGDLRLHGRKTGMAKQLIKYCDNHPVDVLLMEGTHFGFPDGSENNEYQLEDEIVKHVSEAPKLVLASFSPQHVDRLVAFIRTAKKTNRVFVADVYTAFILYLIQNEIPVPTADKDKSIKVFYPKTLLDSKKRKNLNSTLEKFEKSRIEMDEILANPSKYLMIFRPSMLEPDFGGIMPHETTCLYSTWSGYREKPDWKAVTEKINEAEGEIINVHTSGHMLSSDIVCFVKAISPKTIIPVHTFEPETFQHHFDNVKLLQDGETWMVE